MKIFLPKDRIFFDIFDEIAENIKKIGYQMELLMNTESLDARKNVHEEIMKLEFNNDSLTHRVFIELGNNFITPFDREDIHQLATAMDDILDYAFSASKKIKMYDLTPDGNMKSMANIIAQGCVEMSEAVKQLRYMKNMTALNERLVKINSLENHCDDVYDACVKQLFEEETDVKKMIMLREVYSVLETVTDKQEAAAHVIESVIIKYA